MTNDYLFRALMQMNEDVRKAFVGDLLHLEQDEIRSADIENPIELGTSVDNKEFFLDVKLITRVPGQLRVLSAALYVGAVSCSVWLFLLHGVSFSRVPLEWGRHIL